MFDDLLGQAAWPPPRDWGRPLVTFPCPGDWEVPARLWHWDNPGELHLDRPRALVVVIFVVELTGEPGDMVCSHPVMVHCVGPNRGTQSRFMRIKTQVLTHEGRELRDRRQRSQEQ